MRKQRATDDGCGAGAHGMGVSRVRGVDGGCGNGSLALTPSRTDCRNASVLTAPNRTSAGTTGRHRWPVVPHVDGRSRFARRFGMVLVVQGALGCVRVMLHTCTSARAYPCTHLLGGWVGRGGWGDRAWAGRLTGNLYRFLDWQLHRLEWRAEGGLEHPLPVGAQPAVECDHLLVGRVAASVDPDAQCSSPCIDRALASTLDYPLEPSEPAPVRRGEPRRDVWVWPHARRPEARCAPLLG